MKRINIPQTDLSVSRLAYGTWHLGGEWNQTPPTEDLKQRAVRLIETAVDCGINHIDLADIYTMGKSDEVVGHALRQNPSLRDKLVLQEKCGIALGADPDVGQPQRYDFRYEHIIESVEKSLARVGTDRFDILALHRPDPLIEYEDVARAIDKLFADGKVRYFGVSNHTAGQIALLQKYVQQPIVVNQLEFSLLHHSLVSDGILANMNCDQYSNASGLLDFCRMHQIMVQAWSPTAGGKVFAPGTESTESEKRLADAISKIAQARETTASAVALAWILRHPACIQPILGTLKQQRITESIGADDLVLSRPEWYTLLEAARGQPVP
tara:strand:+ start:93127 stop:94101 length:975 start_codon:yes stop_codon:yes gene_type:complete